VPWGRCVLHCLIIPVTIIPLFPIKLLSIPGEKFSHDGGDTLLAAFKEEMDVTVHKYLGVDGIFPVDDVFSRAAQGTGFYSGLL